MSSQNDVLTGVVAPRRRRRSAYFAFEALAIAGSRSGRYGRGMPVAHALWIGQGGWGVAVALG